MSATQDALKQLRIERRPGARPPRRRRWPWIAAGAAVLLVGGFVALGALRPVPVETTPARDAADPANASVLDASGYIVARRMATVSSKVTGKVREVLIEEGQRVAAGQVLARLDPIDAGAQAELAQAQVAAARSQAGQVRAQLREANANVARLSALVRQQLVSRAQYDQAVAQRDALAAQLAVIDRNTEVARRQLAVAGIGVENTVVRAPFAGVVTAKAAQPGEIVSPISAGGGFTRTGIGTIVDMDSLEVQVDVNEAYIGRVQPGMPVEAVLNAYPDWRIPGEVIAIIPTADRTKATVKVRIALGVKDARIVPDMGVRVSFLERAGANAPRPTGVWIPARAIVLPEGTPADQAAKATRGTVFVAVDGRADAREVPLAELRDADRRVPSGIRPGEAVIVDPTTVRDGQKVTLGAGAK
ncbi:efflux RND transporter periplasmic adaptor subunit [Lysobacter sp. N42]|jgi:RND family efflux transporter MFP subunit|uniref:efflux RND transporter periplasmic adaptor subunit n=1 Tax=Lysobacter sp. N42 TaxID=2545719 RepID=UPI001050A8F6|nr:efflux RND transporter periplasmic adaptor subunit [Lysobacter sp. N42]TCZ87224.1 efflux RND transporter periplasmic adaptor subunit [Lysobacter sp. N42]